MLGLPCCMGLSLVAASRSCRLVAVYRLLIAVLLLLWSVGARVCRLRRLQLSGSIARAQSLRHTNLAAPWDLLDRVSNRVPCLGRWILYYWATREGPKDDLNLCVWWACLEYQYMAVRTVAHEISLWFVSSCLFRWFMALRGKQCFNRSQAYIFFFS